MTDHPIELAAAIVIGAIVMIAAWLLTTDSKVEPPESTPVKITEEPAPRPSTKLSRIELLHLAREHKIHNAKWRARASKQMFVEELLRLEVN